MKKMLRSNNRLTITNTAVNE